MSMAHITTGEHRDVPDQDSYWRQVGVQELSTTGPTPNWMWHSGELDPSSETALRRLGPIPPPRQLSGAGSGWGCG